MKQQFWTAEFFAADDNVVAIWLSLDVIAASGTFSFHQLRSFSLSSQPISRSAEAVKV
jgi:hypothetical protein